MNIKKLNENIEAPQVANGGIAFEEKGDENHQRKLSPPRVNNLIQTEKEFDDVKNKILNENIEFCEGTSCSLQNYF